MTRVDTFPDIEAIVAYELRTQLSARVYSSIPENPTFPLIIVKRIGGIPSDRIRLDSASLQIEIWGNSKSEAFDLAASARKTVFGLEPKVCTTGAGYPVNAIVTGVSDSLGLTWLPDPVTDKDRYIFGLLVFAHA